MPRQLPLRVITIGRKFVSLPSSAFCLWSHRSACRFSPNRYTTSREICEKFKPFRRARLQNERRGSLIRAGGGGGGAEEEDRIEIELPEAAAAACRVVPRTGVAQLTHEIKRALWALFSLLCSGVFGSLFSFWLTFCFFFVRAHDHAKVTLE